MAVSILLPRNNLQCDKCVAYIAYIFVLGTCTSLHHEFHCPCQYYKAFKRSDVFVCVCVSVLPEFNHPDHKARGERQI